MSGRSSLMRGVWIGVCAVLCMGQAPVPSGPPEIEVKAFLGTAAQKETTGPRKWASNDKREWLICVGSAIVPAGKPVEMGREPAEFEANKLLTDFAAGTSVKARSREVVRTKEERATGTSSNNSEEVLQSAWVQASLDATSRAVRCHWWAVADTCYVAIALPLVRKKSQDTANSSAPASAPKPAIPGKQDAGTDDASVKVVRMKGVGTSAGDKAKAIGAARDDACKSALKMVCEMTVRAVDTNKTANFESEFTSKIYGEVSGTIKSSVVIGDPEWADPNASVTMDVTIDTSGIAGKLDQVLQLVGNPTVMVLVEESVDGTMAPDPYIVTELNKVLIQEGMMAVDADTTSQIRKDSALMSKLQSLEPKTAQEQAVAEEARRVMQEFKADVLVLGRMSLKKSPAAGGLTQVSGTLQYRMIDAFSGEILVPDSTAIQATDKDLEMARLFATKKLLGEEGEKTEFLKSLIKQLRSAMQKRMRGTYMTISIADCTEAKDASLVRGLLERLPHARSPAQGSKLAAGLAEFRMRWLGDPQTVTDMLQDSLENDPKYASVAGLELVDQMGTRINFLLRKCADIVVKGTPNGRQKSAINKLLRAAAPPSAKWGKGSVPKRVIGVSDVAAFRDKLFELLDSRGAEWPTLSDETDFDVDEDTNALIITIK